jgi:polyketide synthase PksN
MGHPQMAAGVVGIIKALLAIKHRKMPPLLHQEQTNQNISLAESPFFVHTDLRDWVVEAGEKRRAAVTSLGASGTNAHAVIEEAPVQRRPERARRGRLIALSARTNEALRQQVRRVVAFCQRNPEVDLADVSYTLLLGRQHFKYRLASVVEDVLELGQRLGRWLAGGEEASGVLVSSTAASSIQSAVSGSPEELAGRYLKGETPSFESLFAGERCRRVSLPTYPFEKTRYWLASPPAATAEAKGLTTRLTGDEFFLRDHRVQGSSILPGAIFIQLACAAAAHRRGTVSPQGAVLKDVVFMRPLRLVDGPLNVHTEIRSEDGKDRFQIRNEGAEPDGDKLILCQGEITLDDPPRAGRLDVPALRVRFERAGTNPARFYEDYRELGIEYGPAFRGCQALYTAPGAVLAEIRLPDAVADTLDGFTVHPVLFDSAMQCMRLLASPGREPSRGGLVFAIRKVEVMQPCTSRMWAWVRYAEGEGGTEKIDIDLADDGGRICVAIRGVAAGKISADGKPKGAPAVALLPAWELQPSGGAARWPEISRPVAVIGGTPEARELLRSMYPAAHLFVTGSHASVDEIERAFRSAPAFEHLFWLSPEATLGGGTAEQVIEGQSVGALDLLRVLKGLLAAGHGSRPLGWTLITHRAQAMHEAERIDPTHAAVAGLAGSLAKEYPTWQVRVADLAAYDRSSLQAVLELAADPDGNTCLHRSNQWFSQRLMRVGTPPRSGPGFRERGVYLIAGGAGGLGGALSEHLIRTYRAQVVWLGRRAKDGSTERAIAALSALGPAPHYIQADATDAASLRCAHEEIEQRFGPVNGLINSVLVLSRASLARMTEPQFREVLRGKVDVSVRLMEQFQGRSLELALFLSSTNSYQKAMAQANYAAACTFMDSFAHEAGRRYRCVSKVINLGYCFNNAMEERKGSSPVGKDLELIEREEVVAGVEMLLTGQMRQMTLMKFSPGLNTRGMSVGEEAVVLCQDAAPTPERPVEGDKGELESMLARLPQLRERLTDLTALSL